MIAHADSLLGIGLYTPAEAAFYARIHTSRMKRWLYGDGSGLPVIEPQRGSEDKDVSFLDFVQALAIRSIVSMPDDGPRVSLQKIRAAVNEARKKYRIDFPFATEHCTYLFGKEVVIQIGDDEYLMLTGKTKGNRMITQVVELYMRRLSFGEDRLAEKYHAWGEGPYSIYMDPKRKFGEPYFPEYGYTAETLWKATASEGSVAKAAKTYGVPEEAIETACTYFDYLQGSSAA